jgi:protocatechuate 3,4-dioxygenase beta subunit
MVKRLGQLRLTRGGLLRSVVVGPVAYLLAACSGKDDTAPSEPAAQSVTTTTAPPPAPAAQAEAGRTPTATAQPPAAQALAPTPACGDDDDPTPAQTEGPYFTPNSPLRTSLLEPGVSGPRLSVAGLVLTTDCRPIANALVDFWQCDAVGVYDNRGYRLRGHQFTDPDGRYTLETIVPGVYPGRTRHIHVKVQAPGGRVLTTQQYFPGEPGNARDGIYRRELELATRNNADGSMDATFNFVLQG